MTWVTLWEQGPQQTSQSNNESKSVEHGENTVKILPFDSGGFSTLGAQGNFSFYLLQCLGFVQSGME